MKKQDSTVNMYYIHTTHKIIPYIDSLSKKYFPDQQIVHLLDESILLDINNNSLNLAQFKIANLIDGSIVSGVNKFMITCTAAGGLIKNLNAKHQGMIARIETPSIKEILGRSGKVGVVHTNVPVWGQITEYMKELGVKEDVLLSCYVQDAFANLLNGNTKKHDELVVEFLKANQNNVDCYYLAQVSVCGIKERVNTWDLDVPVVSMAEMGIMQLSS